MCCARASRWAKREGFSLGLEQHVVVTRREAEMRRHGRGREIMPAELLHDERLDLAQPRRPHAASGGSRQRIARGPERCGEQIVHMGDGKLLQLERNQRLGIECACDITH